MNPECLKNSLTATQKRQFEEDGYLIVEQAIPHEALAEIVGVVDRVDSKNRPDGFENRLLSVTDIIPEDDIFLNLIDCPQTFPKVWGILGWNIYLYHSHLDITPPGNDDLQPVAWHQDSMRVNDEIETHPRPRLSLKIGYYLSDVSEPDRGNTLIVPGSHLLDELDCPADGQSSPDGSIPLCLNPGDALLLDRRTWHSRSPNLSELTRKVVWMGYSYRWLMPKDAMTVKHLYEQVSPIRRQLLGDGLSANGVYDPLPDDVPLRAWLEEHSPDDAAWTKHKRPQARPPAHGGRGHMTGRR